MSEIQDMTPKEAIPMEIVAGMIQKKIEKETEERKEDEFEHHCRRNAASSVRSKLQRSFGKHQGRSNRSNGQEKNYD
jgi:hypothetical protein